MKKSLSILLGIGGLLLSILLFQILTSGLLTPAENPFPVTADIQEVRFSYFHPFDNTEAEGVLSPPEVEALSLVFAGSRKDPRPAKWQSLGVVEVSQFSGNTSVIHLFLTGPPPWGF